MEIDPRQVVRQIWHILKDKCRGNCNGNLGYVCSVQLLIKLPVLWISQTNSELAFN